MASDRCGNDKVRCVVLDTNVLIYSFLERVDVLDQLRDLGFNRFYVPSKVVEELNSLSKSLKGKRRIATKLALETVDRFFDVVEVNSIGTDNALIELSRSMGCVLITNDRELKKRAKDLGIQVGYLRGLERVEIEGQNRYI